MRFLAIFANFFDQILWKSVMGPENAPKFFFHSSQGWGGQKWQFFLAKNGFLSPNFSYFWLQNQIAAVMKV